MTRYFAFLRAINVGGHVVKMDRLRQIFESLMQRTKETGISRVLRTTNVRVVDPAEVQSLRE